MLRHKNKLLFLLGLLVTGSFLISLLDHTAYAAGNATVDPKAAFSRTNRTTVRLGTVYFYDSDTTDDTWKFYSVGTDCTASISYSPATSNEGGGTAATWRLSYSNKLQSGNGCGPAIDASLNMPSNWSERANVVLAGGAQDNQVISVMPTNSTVFKKSSKSYNGNTVYIQQGVDAYSCPLVVANSGSRWVLIPLEKKDTESSVSNQIRELFSRELGVSDTSCGPTDNDSLGIFKQFGLPESYFDAGNQKDNYTKISFGFSGETIASATMTIPSIPSAGGIAAQGPLKGGGYDPAKDGGVDAGSAPDSSETTTCAVDGIGWIVCPIMTFIGRMNDAAFGFLQTMLGIRPAVVTSESTQAAWAAFRDIANVAFVIAFMVIVYSQITSAGISNYGIKKMLPRIMIAAILVNASFLICALAVDVSNIVGSSLYALLKDSISVGKDVSATGWQDSISGILEVAATAAGIVLLVVAIAMAPMVLLAFVLIILILVARQALVILLIVVAPLAFVAYLLPNTESWFKKWWKALVTTLMVYPIVALVFGASTLASKVLTEVAASEPDQNMLMLIALGVMAVPLFAVPAILKGSLSAAGSIGGKLSGLADRTQRGAGKQFGGAAKRRAKTVESQMAARGGILGAAGGYRTRRNFRRSSAESKAGQLQEGALADHVLDNPSRYNPRQQAVAVAAKQKISKEQIDNSIALLHNKDAATLVPRAVQQLQKANAEGDVEAARAATQVLTQQTGSRGIEEFHKAALDIEASSGFHEEVSEGVRADVSSAGLKGKDRALDTWSRHEGQKTQLGQHDTDIGTARGLNENELAGQSKTQLAKFASTGSMTQEQAQSVLSAHQKGTIALDPAKLAIFTERANATQVRDVGQAHEEAVRENVNRDHEAALVENSLYDMEQRDPSSGRS